MWKSKNKDLGRESGNASHCYALWMPRSLPMFLCQLECSSKGFTVWGGYQWRQWNVDSVFIRNWKILFFLPPFLSYFFKTEHTHTHTPRPLWPHRPGLLSPPPAATLPLSRLSSPLSSPLNPPPPPPSSTRPDQKKRERSWNIIEESFSILLMNSY